jgi:hypothetical protein
MHLLLMANHEPRYWLGHLISEGQTPIGRKELGESLGLGEQQIRTALNKLKSTNDITIKVYNKFSLITIVNWIEYQSTNQQDDKSITSNQPTTNQQLTTLKELKKERKKESILKPDLVSDSVWVDFLQLRKKKNSPVTQTVIDGISKEAKKANISLNDALAECCVRGWQSFKAEWYNKKDMQQNKPDPYRGVLND